jgi:hypothetical protein
VIYTLVTPLARGISAGFFWAVLDGCYVHSRRPAESDVGVGRPFAGHRKRGERQNRRIQSIDVASEILHDDAAERRPVRATYELDGVCGLPLGGLGLRSHANRGANHCCNRNYSTDCHVVPPWLGPLPAGSQVKQAGSRLRNQKIIPDRGSTLSRTHVRFGSKADMCSAK